MASSFSLQLFFAIGENLGCLGRRICMASANALVPATTPFGGTSRQRPPEISALSLLNCSGPVCGICISLITEKETDFYREATLHNRGKIPIVERPTSRKSGMTASFARSPPSMGRRYQGYTLFLWDKRCQFFWKEGLLSLGWAPQGE